MRGDGYISERGYRRQYDVQQGRYVMAHVRVVERAIGRTLPTGARVHHVNGDKADNRGANLVACQDQAYHILLHKRAEALAACGDPAKRRCPFCHNWDTLNALDGTVRRGGSPFHKRCAAEWQAEHRRKFGRPSRRKAVVLARAKATHCKNGHEFTAGTTRVYKGVRVCKACDRARRPRKGAA